MLSSLVIFLSLVFALSITVSFPPCSSSSAELLPKVDEVNDPLPLHIESHESLNADRQIDKQAGKQTDSQTDRHSNLRTPTLNPRTPHMKDGRIAQHTTDSQDRRRQNIHGHASSNTHTTRSLNPTTSQTWKRPAAGSKTLMTFA